jgi:hypothetical protein
MITFSQLGRYGRLGNQMFQVASVIGIATKYGYEYGFPYWKNYDHLERFGSSENIDIQSWFKNPLPLVDQSVTYPNRFINWGFHNLGNLPDNLDISGHMQSEKYFAHCKDLVRHYFEFAKPVDPLPEGAICIHVRRGDYDDNYHPTQKADYYEAALKHMPSAPVFVFSDDISAAWNMLGNEHTYMGGNHYFTDLQLMASGTHHILSNSTLCWWGWWLSKQEGKVVAPSKWFGQIAGISPKDIYTDQMIVI